MAIIGSSQEKKEGNKLWKTGMGRARRDTQKKYNEARSYLGGTSRNGVARSFWAAHASHAKLLEEYVD